MIRRLGILLASVIFTSAHFHLNYPPTRGFDEPIEGQFCGGFNTPSPSRTQFPIDGGFVSITSEHPMADILIGLSTLNNPTTFTQFNHTANGTVYPFLTPFTVMHAQGDACFPVNADSLGISEIHNGANATIMVQFDGPDGLLYQCADIILAANATISSSVKCDNATGAFPPSTPAGNTGNNTSMSIPLDALSYASTIMIGFIATALLV